MFFLVCAFSIVSCVVLCSVRALLKNICYGSELIPEHHVRCDFISEAVSRKIHFRVSAPIACCNYSPGND